MRQVHFHQEALETEKHDPSLDLAYRISKTFGLPLEQIFQNPY